VKRDRGWRTFKRPGVDDFLQHLGRFYEIVVYSDQLSMVMEIHFLPFWIIFIIHDAL
jgi:TFIIF-interacting CTD phosphatase-like protein